jgi:hypothetical protein
LVNRAASAARFVFEETIEMKSLASKLVLEETRERLLSLKEDDRALWGRMAAAQMVRHLDIAYEMALGERAIGTVKGLSPVMMKWVSLRSGLRWPKNVPTPPDLLRAQEEAGSDSFDERVNAVKEKMGAVVSGARRAQTHPMFGAMTAEDWMRWGYLHVDHHLRQFGR